MAQMPQLALGPMHGLDETSHTGQDDLDQRGARMGRAGARRAAGFARGGWR
jgi:hypothetical protein